MPRLRIPRSRSDGHTGPRSGNPCGTRGPGTPSERHSRRCAGPPQANCPGGHCNHIHQCWGSVDAGAAHKRREEYPTEQILVIKTTSLDHFLTEFVSHVQKPLLAAGFARRTMNNLVQSWRPFTKRGYPKCLWAMCFGLVEDTNAAWAEYEELRAAM
jgi:hypothetical protein